MLRNCGKGIEATVFHASRSHMSGCLRHDLNLASAQTGMGTVAESHKVEFPPREVTCPCCPRLRVPGVRLSLGESMCRAMHIQRDRRRIQSRDLDINSALEYLCKLTNYERRTVFSIV